MSSRLRDLRAVARRSTSAGNGASPAVGATAGQDDTAPADITPASKEPVDKEPLDKVPPGKVPPDKVRAGKVPHDKVPPDKVPPGKVPPGKVPPDTPHPDLLPAKPAPPVTAPADAAPRSLSRCCAIAVPPAAAAHGGAMQSATLENAMLVGRAKPRFTPACVSDCCLPATPSQWPPLRGSL